VTIHIHYLTLTTPGWYVNVAGCSYVTNTLPLNKDASLDGVDDAAEARLLFTAAQHQAHLPGEGGGQPIPHLRGHRL